MKITIIGTGYVGLTTGTIFAELGHEVVCVDSDVEKIEKLQKLKMPLYEPGLEEMVKRNFDQKRLQFTIDIKRGLKESEIVVCAVGTPSDFTDRADVSEVINAATDTGRYINNDIVFVMKSTVPVETTERSKLIIQDELKKKKS